MTAAASRAAFARLWLAHAASAAGDSLVTIALAESVFFGVPTPDEARGRIALSLVLTMAPFALLSPLVGPAIDRHGRRLALVAAGAGRAALALALAASGSGVGLYLAAFGVLTLSRAHGVARNALVASIVAPPRTLVEANAALAKGAVVAGIVAGIPGAGLVRLIGPGAALAPAAALFALAAALGATMPEAGAEERAPGAAPPWPDRVSRAATANAAVRGIGGFLLFLLAFELRESGIGKLGSALVLAAIGGGTLVGASLAPRMRGGNEDRMIAVALLAGGGASLIAARSFGVDLALVLGGALGIVSTIARLAFDAILGRQGPAARGRAFARSETMFQLAWVAGAAVPVAVPIAVEPGLVAASVGFLGAALWFLVSMGAAGRRRLSA